MSFLRDESRSGKEAVLQVISFYVDDREKASIFADKVLSRISVLRSICDVVEQNASILKSALPFEGRIREVILEHLVLGVPLALEASSSEEEVKTKTAAFDIPYTSVSDLEERFAKHLEGVRSEAYSGPSVAYPYFPVIQSSGYGKSRFIIQFFQERSLPSIYWSFGPYSVPRQNVVLERSLTPLSLEDLTHCFAAKIVDVISNPEPLVSISASKSISEDEISKSLSKIDPVELTFIIDEVSRISSVSDHAIRALRRATGLIRKHAGHLKTVFIFMDTFSSISHVSPPMMLDPSHRPGSSSEEVSSIRYPPFIFNETFDILSKTDVSKHDEILDLEHLCCLGRPLWAAYLQTELRDVSKLLEYAGEKVFCCTSQTPVAQMTPIALLASIFCRVAVHLSPFSMLVHSLVSGHMATALHLSKHRDAIYVCYPSEPILAIASRQRISSSEYKLGVLDALKSALSQGIFEKEHRGEIVGQLVLLYAMDSCWKDTPTSVSLEDFIARFGRDDAPVSFQNLVGPLIEDLDSSLSFSATKRKASKIAQGRLWTGMSSLEEAKFDVSKCADGRVFFTHFVYISSETRLISKDTLKKAFCRSAAIVFDEGRQGVDIVIPVFLCEDEYIGLLVQIKNRTSDGLHLSRPGSEESHHKFDMSYIFAASELDAFPGRAWPGLLLCIGVKEVGSAVAEGKAVRLSRDQASFQVYPPVYILTGLRFKFLDEDVCQRLAEIASYRPEEDVPSQMKERIPITCDYS